MTFDQVLARFPDAKQRGSEWRARCTCSDHEDRRPSLDIAVKGDRIVLVCRSRRCPTERIVEGAGLRMGDLFLDNGANRNGRAKPKTPRRIESLDGEIARMGSAFGGRWDYHTADGELVFTVVRKDTPARKMYFPYRPDGSGWIQERPKGQLPLYRLPELLKAPGPILVVEGEKAADAAIALGIRATTWAGGARNAKGAGWSSIVGEDAVVFPDNDADGLAALNLIGAERLKLDAQAVTRSIDIDKRGLPPKGDICDWIEDRGDCRDDDLAGQVVAMMSDAKPWHPPEDAPEEKMGKRRSGPIIPSWQPFPLDTLPDVVLAFVSEAAAATGTDPAFAAVAALTTIAGCVGNRLAAVVKKGWSEPPILWAALVGRSGVTKSPVLKLVTRALVQIYRDWRRDYAKEMETYEKAVASHGVAMSEWKKAQKKGATDPPIEPVPLTERRVVVSDITIERLGALLEENPLGLLLVRDELAAWAGSFDRYAAGGKGSDQPAWLSMYDGHPVLIDRKTGKSNYFIERASVGVLGSIQPGTLSRLFSVAEREAGLLARLLLVYPPERAAPWSDAELSDSVAESWKALLADLLNLPGGTDESGDPRPNFLPLSADARAAWITWHNRHVEETLAIGDDDLAAHFAKLKGAGVRFALALAAVQAATDPRPVTNISGDAMRRAIAIADWFKAHSRRAYALLAETASRKRDRELVEWIASRGGSVSLRDLTHGRRAFRDDPEGARKALGRLAADGLGRWDHPCPGEAGGRPSERFVLLAPTPRDETPLPGSVRGGFGDGDAPGVLENGKLDSGDGPPVDPDRADALAAEADGALFDVGSDAAEWGRR